MKTVNIGIVGLGRLGRRHALNLLASVPGAVLVAAASPVAEERQWGSENLPGAVIYASLGELLKHDGLDAVWLVTPTSLHVEQIQESLLAGKHVFCEKPHSLDAPGLKRVAATCEEVLPEELFAPAPAGTLREQLRSIGQAFYWVIGAHIVAALWHHLFRRDDTLKRML